MYYKGITLMVIFHLPLCSSVSQHMFIYQNARFNPFDNHFLLTNLSSIQSQDACVCQCLTNSMCVTVMFDGFNHYCSLYFAQIYEGNLQIVSRDRLSNVIYFDNRTIPAPTFINMKNETVYGIWNTTASGNSMAAVVGTGVGNYNNNETPTSVFDEIISTNYWSFGHNLMNFPNITCGEKTGFYVTLKRNSILLRSFRIRSGHYSVMCDPLMITIEGSNAPNNSLIFGSSWTLIYTGSSGLEINLGRSVFGTNQTISNNSKWYSSYRLLVTEKKGLEYATEYAEVEFYGY